MSCTEPPGPDALDDVYSAASREDHGSGPAESVCDEEPVPSDTEIEAGIKSARRGVQGYLDDALSGGLIDTPLFNEAQATIPNLEEWLHSRLSEVISANVKRGILRAIDNGEWEKIVNAFRRHLSFGTGGIRGMMAQDRSSIVQLLESEEGLDAPILKGPNTINSTVLLRVSAGVARFGNDKGYSKIIIGYDSRVRGKDFAQAIAELFLEYGFKVFLFDEPCPYPEVTFAIPFSEIKADLGILISASHNDYRYNGYKLSCCNGSQFDPNERDELYKRYITKATFADVKRCSLHKAPDGKLIWLGGVERLNGVEYYGRPLFNIHDRHRDHIQQLLATDVPDGAPGSKPVIGYCAFHGAGRKAVPRLLGQIGLGCRSITVDRLNELDGLFPSFSSDPGREQQPDPGDPRAAEVAVNAFKKEFPGDFENTDILIGTDPDADRCGVVVKVPEDQRHLYDGKEYTLLSADDMWALILWFRLDAEMRAHGKLIDPGAKFIALSTSTTDAIVRLARKHGLGVVKSWVGFANMAAVTQMVWEKEDLPALVEGRQTPQDPLCHPFIYEHEGFESGHRSFNCAAMEQSNGFSILGGPPPDERSLGTNGHVRDKDGTLAAILIAEIATYAKRHGTTIFEMVDKHIHLDPDVGLFVTRYEPDPLDGEYPGIQGDRKKKRILRRGLGLFQFAKSGGLKIGPLDVTDAAIYRTGKYDHVYPPTYDFQFPDEGIRLYFDESRFNYTLIRPSGTGNSLRFHVQLHSDVDESTLIDTKALLRRQAKEVIDDLRVKLEAPRSSDI